MLACEILKLANAKGLILITKIRKIYFDNSILSFKNYIFVIIK